MQANERCTKIRIGYVPPQVFVEISHINPHIEPGCFLQAKHAASQ